VPADFDKADDQPDFGCLMCLPFSRADLPRVMGGQDIRVLLFGDQSEERIEDLRELVKVTDNPLLKAFIEEAYQILRSEVAYAPAVTRSLPSFTSIETLLWRYGDSGVRHPAIESALVIIHQVSTFLRYVKFCGCGQKGRSQNDPKTARLSMMRFCGDVLVTCRILPQLHELRVIVIQSITQAN
jgi:hypothetical protein